MAEVTSGTDLTVIVLNQAEAHALARLLHATADGNGDPGGEPRLWQLYDALVPTEDDEPARRCGCGYLLDGYASDEDVCGACLDNPIAYMPTAGAA